MSGLRLCYLLDGGGHAASYEGDQRLRWPEDLSQCRKEEAAGPEKSRWEQRRVDHRVPNAHLYPPVLILVNSQYIQLGPKEAPAKDTANNESFSGSRKNKLKSRLIIRNLSFKVSLQTEIHQPTSLPARSALCDMICALVLRGGPEECLLQIWGNPWGQYSPQTW